jgi:hypothetical protein
MRERESECVCERENEFVCFLFFCHFKKIIRSSFFAFFSFRILHPCLFLSPSTLSVFFTMPELPEVEAARQTAEEHLLNKTIVEASAVEDESAFGLVGVFSLA